MFVSPEKQRKKQTEERAWGGWEGAGGGWGVPGGDWVHSQLPVQEGMKCTQGEKSSQELLLEMWGDSRSALTSEALGAATQHLTEGNWDIS